MIRSGLLALALVATTSFVAPDAHALELAKGIRDAGRWGIGFGGGVGVSGISTKYFFTKGLALQGIVGAWGYNRNVGGVIYSTGLGIDVDLLFELPTIAMAGDVMELGWSIGPGAWIGIGDPFVFAANGVLGLEFNFIPVPIDLVIEYKPSVIFTPEVGFDYANFGGHIRIYFM